MVLITEIPNDIKLVILNYVAYETPEIINMSLLIQLRGLARVIEYTNPREFATKKIMQYQYNITRGFDDFMDFLNDNRIHIFYNHGFKADIYYIYSDKIVVVLIGTYKPRNVFRIKCLHSKCYIVENIDIRYFTVCANFRDAINRIFVDNCHRKHITINEMLYDPE